MNIFRKLLLVLIVIIFTIIIFKILKERNNIYSKIESEKMQKELEPFTLAPAERIKMDNSVKSVAIDPTKFPNKINSVVNTTSVKDLSLNQFCIKGSYNSAYSGTYITPTMVQYVLSRGCRALDFEVYMDGEQRPIVGYSPDQSAINPSSKYVSNAKFPYFKDILKTAIQSAFHSTNGTAYSTPNKDDPLFVNIRLKTDEKNKKLLFDLVQDDIRYLKQDYISYFYKHAVDPSGTTISQLKRKIVIIFESIPSFTIERNMGHEVNMILGAQINIKRYYQLFPNSTQSTPPSIINNNQIQIGTNGTIPFTMVLPDNGKSSQPNMNIFSAIQNYGCQMNMFQYYVNDLLLIQNEDIFNTYNGGIVPMAYCLSYTQNYSTKDDVIPGVNTVFPNAFAGITRDTWLPNE